MANWTQESKISCPTSMVGTAAGTPHPIAAAATPAQLVTASTACRFVWIGAPCVAATGVAVNTTPAFIGDVTNQCIPLLPNNFEGVIIHIDDASKIYVKVGVNGEGVHYRIFV
ncbi:MAG: hypothetical protein HQ546_06875 [Planctomycetes bacterium]|nr:hypothetical protein [Planctomycetota bacterium]